MDPHLGTWDGPRMGKGSMSARATRTPKKREAFLRALATTANVLRSCKAARVSRTAIYDWRAADEDFAKAWDTALDLGSDALEDEAVRRATEGTLKPVFHLGVKCGSIREYSDTLLIFLLKGRRPEKYRERHELSGPNGGPIPHAVTKTPLTKDELRAELQARGLPTTLLKD